MKKSNTSIVRREGCFNNMRLLLVNSVCGIRSTGRIVADIAKEYEAKGWEVRIGYGRIAYVPDWCKKWAVRIGNRFDLLTHVLMLSGNLLVSWHDTHRLRGCSIIDFVNELEGGK